MAAATVIDLIALVVPRVRKCVASVVNVLRNVTSVSGRFPNARSRLSVTPVKPAPNV
jgi:hypothetical protein